MNNEEIELKLRLAPDQARKLQRSGVVRQLARDRARRQHLKSTYFDTPDMLLKRHGMALRIRREGRRAIQTLKAPKVDGDLRSALQELLEFETEVGGGKPDLSLIDHEGLRKFFKENRVAEELEPIFMTEFDRQARPLKLSESEIELAIDTGRILADGREQALCEAELELLAGRPAHVFELALMLLDKVPFRLETESKAARGYALIERGQEAIAVKAERPKLSKSMTLAQAFEATLRSGLAHLRANEAVVLEGANPNGVHQMRVAIRRLRALVTAFKRYLEPEFRSFLRRELRVMQQRLGPAREWDVFLTETVSPLTRRLPGEEALAWVREGADELRREADEGARQAILDPRYTVLLLRIELWLETGRHLIPAANSSKDPASTPVGDYATDLLRRRDRKLRKQGKAHRQLSDTELHKLRIRAKEARYAADFFGTLYSDKKLKRYISRLTEIQNCLGSLNDAVTGHRLLDQLHHRFQSDQNRSDRPLDNALGIVLGWQGARIEDDLKEFPKVWKKFAKTDPFWI